MKRTIIAASLLIATLASEAAVVKSDPLLTGAVVAQTVALQNVYNERKKTEEAILASEETTNFNLDKIHDVEKKALSYLSNAQGAVQNLYQIKQAAELVSTTIPNTVKELTSSIPDHLVGTAVSALVTKQINKAYAEMASLYPYMQQLVTSGTYNISGHSGDKKGEAHKVNLLNSSERYFVAQQVVSRLERINRSLSTLAYEVRTLGVKDYVQVISPETWHTYSRSKGIAKEVINRWKSKK